MEYPTELSQSIETLLEIADETTQVYEAILLSNWNKDAGTTKPVELRGDDYWLWEIISPSLYNYLIIRVCVFQEELTHFNREFEKQVGREAKDAIDAFYIHWNMFDFKDARNWRLAHPRKRIWLSKKDKQEVHLSSHDKKGINLPSSMEVLSKIVELADNVAYELDDEFQITDEAKERWRRLSEEGDDDIDDKS